MSENIAAISSENQVICSERKNVEICPVVHPEITSESDIIEFPAFQTQNSTFLTQKPSFTQKQTYTYGESVKKVVSDYVLMNLYTNVPIFLFLEHFYIEWFVSVQGGIIVWLNAIVTLLTSIVKCSSVRIPSKSELCSGQQLI